MSSIESASALEKAAGSLTVGAALAVVSAAAGTPLAALLPVLASTLASQRQKQRVEATLAGMNESIAKHQAQLAVLTDQQYKFINEAVLALLHTTNESKMEFLRNVVHNGLSTTGMEDHEAVFLSRVIRDISAEEAHFLIENFGYERIWLNDSEPGKSERPTLAVLPDSQNGRLVLGLLTLGLVTTAEPTYDDSGLLRFSPFAVKVIALLRKPDA
jgi:hypothetical protein